MSSLYKDNYDSYGQLPSIWTDKRSAVYNGAEFPVKGRLRFALMKYIPHGSYSLLLGEAIIYCRLENTFNLEAALLLSDEVMDLLTVHPRKVSYIDNRHWGLATPDAQAVLSRLNRWTIEQGLRFNIHIVETEFKKTLIDMNLAPQNEHYKRIFFSDEKPAVAWLRENGISVEDSELDALYGRN